ncbi:hypothetical protein KIL84_018632 [Mauremys mutica]|uniref:Uncharacterized protein n=1 Tax=Mauremys mutica TaxID=74926 RepID=A0A9D3XTK9_9SAUR|nr:hypothetical protein KIL84_018632 [Mauremys mutica]
MPYLTPLLSLLLWAVHHFFSRQENRNVSTHPACSFHSLKASLEKDSVHIELAFYQEGLTNGRLSGNTEKNFKHVLYLLRVQHGTLRSSLHYTQPDLGISLQSN